MKVEYDAQTDTLTITRTPMTTGIPTITAMAPPAKTPRP